ncbi:MAG: LPXTG cell wall anchor domain-containing protein [Acidobacteria bacterium]|nr:LPXTG cell wall anchor domain-containing protein [Acidobacteriota bacterium]
MRISRQWIGATAIGLALFGVAQLRAQAPAGMMEIGEGTVLARVGETLVVDVKKGPEVGIRKFVVTSDRNVRFFKNGAEVDVFSLRKGDYLVAYGTEGGAGSVQISQEEANQLAAKTQASDAGSGSATMGGGSGGGDGVTVGGGSGGSGDSSAASRPARLPHTASRIPAAATAGLALMLLGGVLFRSRRND